MDHLKNLIDGHDYISFDIFDTLLFRNVQDPKDIFLMVGDNYNKKHNSNIVFQKIRQHAEDEARKVCQFREVNLDEIYSLIEKKVGVNSSNELKKLEIEITNDLCVVNPEINKYFQYCVEQKKHIFIISDMFFSSVVLKEILKKHGISEYREVYSSCDIRLTKWQNGDLFHFVAKKNEIAPKLILHIGNDRNADYKMAKHQGWDAYLYQERRKAPLYECPYFLKCRDNVYYKSMQEFFKNTVLKNENQNFILGFQVFGPLLYGYLNWINCEAKSKGLRKILFISRDGYILKKGFDYLESDVNSKYFYASRRAFIVPLLCDDYSLNAMMEHYKSWSYKTKLKELMKRLGLDHHKYIEVLNSLQLTSESEFNSTTLANNGKINLLFDAVKSDIWRLSVDQNRLLLRYLQQENISGKVGISDIGAACTIEHAFSDFASKNGLDISLVGLYLCTSEKLSSFIPIKEDRNVESLFRFCYMLLEVFLSAPHGTVLGYKEENGKVKPVYGKYEYEDELEQNDSKKIQDLQDGALYFVKLFSRSGGKYYKFDYELALANFFSFGLLPSKGDLKCWGDFRFDSDDFSFLAKPKKLTYYMFHPKQMVDDMKCSLWLSGFLMRLFQNKLLIQILFFLKSR